jgi:hypothetical protein
LAFAKDGARDVKLYLDNERISEAGFSFEMNVWLQSNSTAGEKNANNMADLWRSPSPPSTY